MAEIVVVGNAPVKNRIGWKVDKFKTVIRLNSFKPGFESFIGRKTSIISIGGSVKPDNRFKCPVWGSFPAHSYDAVFQMAAPLYGKRLLRQDVRVIGHLQFKLGYLFPSRFSTTGLTTIELALHNFKEKPIYTVGFELGHTYSNIWDEKPVWIGDKGEDGKYHPHDMGPERMYYDELLAMGHIKELE